jgi:sec-independent protein translocase protein TatC
VENKDNKLEKHGPGQENGFPKDPNAPIEQEEKSMSFLDHLEELRWHIIRSLIAIVVFTVAALLARDFVWGTLILGPTKPDFWTYQIFCKLGMLLNSDYFCIDKMPFIIQSRQMTGQMTMYLSSSVVIGIICTFPYAFWEIWRFVSPGLYDNERSLSRGAVFFVSLLFALGVLFGYYIIAPVSVNFLGGFQVDPSIMNEFDITSYVGTMITLILACGLLFQLPIVVYFLTKAGIVTPEFLKTYRKHSIVVILVLSALVTPPDVISQMLVAIPLLILYQISIYISKVVRRKELKIIEDDNM